MIFIVILIILLILFYISEMVYKESFLICDKQPSGPYETKCTNIKFKDNNLSALCLSDIDDNTYVSTQLDLEECVMDNNDCDGININKNGDLICE
jgi:hypothetical protein